MARARVKQLPLTKAMDAEARKQNKLVGNQKDRGQAELAALRESLKSQARHVAKRPVQSPRSMLFFSKFASGTAMPNSNGPSGSSTSRSTASSATRKKGRTPHTADLMTEFCPRCGMPVDTGGDERRICDTCGWFGDNAETAKRPPDTDDFNPVLAAVQALALVPRRVPP